MNEFVGAGSSRPMKIYDFLFNKTYKAIRLVKRIVVKPNGRVKREKNWNNKRSQRPRERKNAARTTLSRKKAVLKKIANKTTELNETVKNREAVKQKIESNIENVELQNDLRNLTVEELRISKEIEEYKIKIEELKLSSDSSEIDRLRTKINSKTQ